MNPKAVAVQALREQIADTENTLTALQKALAVLEEQEVLAPAPDHALPAPSTDPVRHRKRQVPADTMGKPWNKRGSTTYWKRQAGMHNIQAVHQALTEAGPEGLLQTEIAVLADIPTATVSRAITYLWKVGEIQWMRRERTIQGQGKAHGTSTRWRLWEGEGNPPIPND